MSMIQLKPKQAAFIRDLSAMYPGKTVVTRKEITAVMNQHGHGFPAWLTGNMAYRAARGEFRVDGLIASATGTPVPASSPTATPAAGDSPTFADLPVFTPPVPVGATSDSDPSSWAMATGAQLVPDKLASFIPFGIYNDVHRIIKSGLFYPVFITGLSGNGKTESVCQACAAEGRELFMVSITCETDEDDLLGGFRLVGGATVWQDGPVVEAMKRGAVLLLDELDYASNKISCLQSVLTGKGVFLKKINTFVKPAPGFQILATANTKGQGDENGKFVGTNVLNEAFLDRFPSTLEQDYPTPKVERKILKAVSAGLGVSDDAYIDILVNWASGLRKNHAAGSVSEVITTRRLIQIMSAYAIFRDRIKAIEVATARFDLTTKQAFLEYYKSLDANASGTPAPVATQPEIVVDEIPY